MKLKNAIPSLAVAVLAAVPIANAQNATTTPVGFMTYTIAAGATSGFCIPLQEGVPSDFVGAANGRISAVTSNTISVDNAGWNPGNLSIAATPYFVRITSGAAEGRLFDISTGTQNTATTVTVNTQGSDLTTLGIVTGASGDTFQIIPADTLFTLFGNSTTQGGPDSSSADIVSRWTGTSWQNFYFNTTNNRWQLTTASSNANNIVLRPDVGYLFTRNGATPIELTSVGAVPTTDVQISVNNSGSTYIANGFPANLPLNSFKNNITDWASTDSPDTSDTVSRFTGTSWQSFYFNNTNQRWQLSTNNANASSVTIAAGTPVLINRVGSAGGAQFVSQLIPYSLE